MPKLWNQFNTFKTLLNGHLGKGFSPSEIKSNNNIGLGTFVHGDGELVMIDGQLYKIINNCQVKWINNDDSLERIPFATCTKFTSDYHESYNNLNIPWDEFLKLLNRKLTTAMAACVLNATFTTLKLRSLNKITPPYPPFGVFEEQQTVSEFYNIDVKVVMFKTLDTIDGNLTEDWHSHCISNDLKAGGHILSGVINNGELNMMNISEIKFHTL